MNHEIRRGADEEAAAASIGIEEAALWDEIASNNSAATEQLLARQRLVKAGEDCVPAERLEEGMPLRRSDETMAISLSPDRDNGSGESS